MRSHMDEQRLEKALRQYESPAPGQDRKELTKLLAAKALAKKPLTQGKPLSQRVREQAAYISPVTWTLQAVVLLVTLSRLSASNGSQFFTMLSIMAPLLGIIGGCELIRSYDHNMWELEMACRHNLRSIFAVKLLILGLADFLVLAAVIYGTGLNNTKFALTAVMILVPFNLSNSLYLWLIVKLRHRCTNYVLAGAGIFLSLIMLWINGALNQSLLISVFSQYMVTMPILAASLALVIFAAAILLRNSGKGYNKWNYI
ncbi:Uncharacterised protein [uncultured Eubacterium sp.]|nr:Uncharacterised protein [uncultured Eubacterium sp.]